MPYPTSSAASDVWTLKDVYQAEAGDDWPFIPTLGRSYADSYITTTSGTITPVATTDNLTTAVANATDGDVLLLEEGTHSLDGSIVQASFTADPFQGKNVLICGDTDVPQNVLINYDSDGTSPVRDEGIFNADGNVKSTYRQIAFLAWRTVQTHTNSYSASLTINNLGSTNGTKGIAVNCYIDYNNGNIAWVYDNNNSSTPDLQWHRCTFANYASWLTRYSGSTSVTDVGNCLFDDTTQSEYVDLGGNVTSATVDTINRTYNTGTYSTAGHLYIPNTTAIF